MKQFARLTSAFVLTVTSLLHPTSGSAAPTAIRVAMTAGDIPDWAGLPDQGAEGFRFVANSLYDALVGWDLSRSDIEAPITPALATSWNVDPDDNNRWIFRLRSGVKFHDGCAFDADGVVFNINRLIDSKAVGYHAVQAARARSSTWNIAGVEKVDDLTVAFRTKDVESLFAYDMPRLVMISPCALQKANYDLNVYRQAPAGTGPYRFDRVVPHERLELVKNDAYWNAKRIPKHDRLILMPMPEASTRAAAMLSGQADFIEAPATDMIDRLKAAKMNVITNPYPHTWHYILNFQRGPFQDLRVRQAANYAINRDEIIDLVNGTAIAAYGIFMPTSKFYGKPFEYRYDPKKATALLKEANCYPCKLTVGISPNGSGQMQPMPMNALVKSQLDEAGFDVDFVVMDWDALVAINRDGWQKTPQFDAVNISLNSSDPLTGFLKTLNTTNRTPNGLNWGWYTNAELDRLNAEIMATFDLEKQTALLQQAHELIVKDAARVFIVNDLNPRALSPKLKGFVQAQSWYQDMTPIVVEQ